MAYYTIRATPAYEKQDPLIKQRVIQLAGELATGPLKRNPGFVLKVFEFTLRTHCPEEPNADTYNDAVKDLQNFCSHQLQKFAMRFPDYLIVSCWHLTS